MLKVTEWHDQSALKMCINNDKKQTENKNTEVRNMQYTEKKNDTRPVEGNKMDKQLPAKDENIWEIQDRRRQKNYKSIVYGKLTTLISKLVKSNSLSCPYTELHVHKYNISYTN
ncbi:hypothetical protein QE152_g773 [Popillia japonica]|uniref:Uncharacterized protein n=1 Tax=Popillia japonica TaxID=7064 RepID=A0AAW1N4N5_POPJA